MLKTINFVLAANSANSITRVVAEYANALVSRGFKVCISYPVFSFWDHHAWCVERETNSSPNLISRLYRFLKFWWYILFLAVKTAVKSRSFKWQGAVIHKLDKRIKLNRFLSLPHAHDLPEADVMLVMQNYFIPQLLFLPASKGKIIGSIHMDYKAMVNDHDETSRSWWNQFLSIDQQLRVPRFAVSMVAKTSAEEFGINVEKVIPNGINLEEFNDCGRPVLSNEPLRVMLFCATLPAKGQNFGCEVVRRLKQIYQNDKVRMISIGEVKDEYRPLFDENLGYLHQKEYVRAYQNADIFIYPSLRDGFPAPPLEAMACGCALITTRVAGLIEYGLHEKNCLMVEVNDIGGMVENVKKIIDNEDLRKRIQKGGIETAKEYTWDKSAKRLIDFINILK